MRDVWQFLHRQPIWHKFRWIILPTNESVCYDLSERLLLEYACKKPKLLVKGDLTFVKTLLSTFMTFIYKPKIAKVDTGYISVYKPTQVISPKIRGAKVGLSLLFLWVPTISTHIIRHQLIHHCIATRKPNPEWSPLSGRFIQSFPDIKSFKISESPFYIFINV